MARLLTNRRVQGPATALGEHGLLGGRGLHDGVRFIAHTMRYLVSGRKVPESDPPRPRAPPRPRISAGFEDEDEEEHED